MDEPASALDPVATMQLEDTMFELKKNYTIIIVTHNMQQAARASDYTAFFYLGDLIEYDKTNIFSKMLNCNQLAIMCQDTLVRKARHDRTYFKSKRLICLL